MTDTPLNALIKLLSAALGNKPGDDDPMTAIKGAKTIEEVQAILAKASPADKTPAKVLPATKPTDGAVSQEDILKALNDAKAANELPAGQAKQPVSAFPPANAAPAGLTKETISQMSAEQINANWDTISQTLPSIGK